MGLGERADGETVKRFLEKARPACFKDGQLEQWIAGEKKPTPEERFVGP